MYTFKFIKFRLINLSLCLFYFSNFFSSFFSSKIATNKITTLPADIFTSLTQLRELQLYKNKLTIIPPEVGNLKGISLSFSFFFISSN